MEIRFKLSFLTRTPLTFKYSSWLSIFFCWNQGTEFSTSQFFSWKRKEKSTWRISYSKSHTGNSYSRTRIFRYDIFGNWNFENWTTLFSRSVKLSNEGILIEEFCGEVNWQLWINRESLELLTLLQGWRKTLNPSFGQLFSIFNVTEFLVLSIEKSLEKSSKTLESVQMQVPTAQLTQVNIRLLAPETLACERKKHKFLRKKQRQKQILFGSEFLYFEERVFFLIQKVRTRSFALFHDHKAFVEIFNWF